ncbi:hypothetical protein Ae201684P_000887 [Aphanomyces euteiches]|nr:hypothetical protein Ae201684P_000887 [Aphanomyces euteiches]
MDSTAGTRDPQTAHVVVMDTNATPHAMSLDNSSTPLTAAPQPLEEYTQTRPIFDTSDMGTTSPLDQDVAASAEPPTDAVGQPAAQDSTATPSPNPHTALSDDMDVSVPEPAHTSHSPQRTQRARRLHLPSNIAQHKLEAAQASLRRMVEQWTAAIDDDDTWTSTGRTLDELPSILTQLVHSLSSGENPTASAPSTSAPLTSNQPSPCEPRTHTHRRSNSGPRRQSRLSQRIDNAIHDLHTTEKSANRNRIQHARRRVSRLKRAQSRLDLRELFNRSPAKCVDQILRPHTSPLFIDPPVNLTQHRLLDLSLPQCSPPCHQLQQCHTPLSDAITTDEIETALDTCRLDSAPGLDGIPYRILYKFRLTLLPYLTAAFNSCWTHKRIPQGWKQSVTELIHKKGDPMDPSNWRPLALQSTLYKLYITVVKSRFSTWLECNNRFNNAQKGFRAFNGCHEHNFLSQSVMDTTRRKAKPLFVVWYDLRNAFGSIVVPVLLRDVYSDASTMVSTKDGLTQPIAQQCGVFQGCPLSPLLFIADMIPLIEALQQHAPTHSVELSSGNFTAVTAFADDIKIYSRSADGITKLHDIISRFLSWTTMAANPSKCALLAVDCTVADYGLRHVRATKTEMAGFTAFLYRCLRQLLRLPRFSCNDCFAAPATSGGLGLLPLDEHKDALVLSHAFQMLHSIDDSIQSLAREQLRHIVHTRYLIDPKDLDEGGDLLLQHYLNGTIDSLPGILPRRSHNDVASLWTDVARILQRYKLQFHSANGQHFMLSLPHMDKPVTSATVARHTKLHLKNIHADAWTDLKDQGRHVEVQCNLGL